MFVRKWAEFYNFGFHLRELSTEQTIDSGFQEWARNWRRRECINFINTILPPSESCDKEGQLLILKDNDITGPTTSHLIATAHTADDQVETMLLKLLRGVHISKLQPVSISVL